MNESNKDEGHTPEFPRFGRNNGNIMNNLNFSALKLNNVPKKNNNGKGYLFIKKKKNKTVKKSVKSKKSSAMSHKNRINATRKAKRSKKVEEVRKKHFKVVRIYSHGVVGLEELIKKLERLQRLYDKATLEEQDTISMYTSILTTEIHGSLDENMKNSFEKYKEVYDIEMAQDDSINYISSLIPFLDKLKREYKRAENNIKNDNNNAMRFMLDGQIENILDAAVKAGSEYESIGKNKKDEVIDDLADIFGALGV